MPGDIATDLLLDLEQRLQRAEFYLTGAHEPQDVPSELKPPVYKRLLKLEQGLRDLSASHEAYRDLLKLYSKHGSHFDVRNVLPIRVVAEPNGASDVSLMEQLSIVNACAPMFLSTVSRLNLLKDTPIPSPESSAALLAITPRLDRAEDVCDLMSEDLTALRTRTMQLQLRIFKLANLSVLGCWAELEQRLIECERAVRRAEIAKEED